MSMKTNEINIRDPFILPHEGKYYMYGTRILHTYKSTTGKPSWGFDVYISSDLENWSGPQSVFEFSEEFWATKDAWAPEVYKYHEKFYMFASFYAKGKMRATQALVADTPEGPFRVWSEPLTPPDWMGLDGTLYVEDGRPYLVFCHEWLQVKDGEIAIVPLKEDLSIAIGEPEILFKASESGWAQSFKNQAGEDCWVTDGPWLVKDEDALIMFWSSVYNDAYAVGIAISESGKLRGPWKHCDRLLFEKDGGHGMMFEGFDGKKYYALHQPNSYTFERPHFIPVEGKGKNYHLAQC